MKTVLQLKTEIRRQCWPSGQPENLAIDDNGGISAHDLHFQEAFNEVANWVESERETHTDVIPFVDTQFSRGMTVFPKPNGIIRRVFTVLQSDVGYVDPVYYEMKDWPEPEIFARSTTQYLMDFMKKSQQTFDGMAPSQAGTDTGCGRSRYGVFSVKNSRWVYLAPWLQSNELIVIEWDGIKTEWADTDLVNESRQYAKCVKLFWQYCHERDFGQPDRAALFHTTNPGLKPGAFDEALGDLMHIDRENRRTRGEPVPSVMGRIVTFQMITAGNAPDQESMQTITQNGPVDLSFDTTMLMSQVGSDRKTIICNLPEGTFIKQTHDFIIPEDFVETTENFSVNGRFGGGYGRLFFNSLGTFARVLWDGLAWQLVGGNAELQTYDRDPLSDNNDMQSLFVTGTIDLLYQTHLLRSPSAIPASPATIQVVMPDGDHRQNHTIFIPSDIAAITDTWQLNGKFTGPVPGGYTKLILGRSGTMAVLLWDGFAWQLEGGNGQLQP